MSTADRPENNAARFLPPLAVFLFLLHLGWVLVDPDKPLADPGTGWHVKLGEMLVREGRIPATDPLSYTLPGRAWVDYQWLSHLLMGMLHRAGGLPLLTAGWSLAFALIPLLLVRRLMHEGTPVLCAWFLAFTAYLVMTMHAQVRPHVVTYLLMVLLLGWLAGGWRQRWWAVLLFPFWCNLHAGFMAGLVVLAAYAAGECAAAWIKEKHPPVREMVAWAGLGLLCGLATLVNPWGWALHRHILDLLHMKMVSRWEEYLPVWHHQGANVALFAGLALFWAWAACAHFRKARPGELASGAVLLYFAIGAVRHVNLFVIAALPLLGLALASAFDRFLPGGAQARQRLLRDQRSSITTWVYTLMAGMGFLALTLLMPGLFRRDLRGLQVSAEGLDAVGRLPVEVRLFHPESMGGVIAYTYGPERRVFVDDRLDYFGDDFFLHTYLPLLDGAENWREMFDRLGVGAALVPQSSGLARRMRDSTDWRMDWSDDEHILFERRGP
ncbi:MAG: hypothetical protein SFU85_07920 [Candidatus Methylacidiphilales bacterium]|nr:hypothetical protein [Candidatus Methylacidiphilales bacterium]